MTTFIPIEKRALAIVLGAGVLVALLPLAIALSPEKAVAAHMIGVMIAALAAKTWQWPSRGDGLLMAGAGALLIVVPIFVWQMPTGAAWGLPILGAVTAAAGLRHAMTHGDLPATSEKLPDQPPAGQ